MACSDDTIEKDEQPCQVSILIPSDYVQSAQSTIESIYGGIAQDFRLHNHYSKLAEKCAYVSFVRSDVTESALSAKHIWPNGQSIHITKVSRFYALNDNCLLHLYQYLNIVDIANASEAIECLSRFAAEHIYDRWSPTLDLTGHPHNTAPRCSYDDLNYVLKHFGKFVTHLSVSDAKLTEPITNIGALLQYCPNLVQIRFDRFSFERNGLESLCSVPLRASEAHFIECDGIFDDWSALWTKWSSLRSLSIRGCWNGGYMRMCRQSSLLDTLVNLETLSLVNCVNINGYSLLEVCRSNRALTSLTLIDIRVQSMYDQIFDRTPNLRHLVAHISDSTQISDSLKLHNLKRLQLIIDLKTGATWAVYFESFKSLEELDIWFVESDSDVIEAAARVHTLRVLSIRHSKQGHLNIFETVAKLPNLKQLHLSHCARWSDADTIQILERNRGIEEIIVHCCSYKIASVPKLVDCLTKQASSLKNPRPTVRLTIIESIGVQKDVDHTLLKVNYKLGKPGYSYDGKWEDDYTPNELDFYSVDDI